MINFKGGNAPEYADRQIQQKLVFGSRAFGLELNGNDENNTQAVLENLQALLKETNDTFPLPLEQQPGGVDDNIRLPFVHANEMVGLHFLEQYREKFLDLFQFDQEACCNPGESPAPDESVFHFRNFLSELKGATKELGFQELDPQRTASQLFGNLMPGDKVAITTRFHNEVTQKYVHAMEKRGLTVRVIAGQSAVQDFCFLQQSQKELVGLHKSSFFTWAAYLGQYTIQTIRSYSVLSSTTTKKLVAWPPPNEEPLYQWKHDSHLRERWHFEEYYQE
jgi:hypothetical protein